MFVLSDDKSARAQFTALIAVLKKDVKDAEYNRAKHSERSQACSRWTGRIEALNDTIALITSIDVMHQAPKPESIKHYHICNLLTKEPERTFYSVPDAQAYLEANGFPPNDLWDAFLQGADIRVCDKLECVPPIVARNIVCACDHAIIRHALIGNGLPTYCKTTDCKCRQFTPLPKELARAMS